MDDLRTLRLERCDPQKGMLRFYALQVMSNLFGEWCLLRAWGRIGRRGQMRTEWFKTRHAAEEALRTLEKAKRKRGYREKVPHAAQLKRAGQQVVVEQILYGSFLAAEVHGDLPDSPEQVVGEFNRAELARSRNFSDDGGPVVDQHHNRPPGSPDISPRQVHRPR